MEHLITTTPLRSLMLTFIAGLYGAVCFVEPLHASETTLELLPSPAPINSSLSRVVADDTGQVFLSWVSQDDDGASLSYARLTNNGWTVPEVISQGGDWFINWADFPALSVNEGDMAALWLRKSAEGAYDYNIEARFYDSNKHSWSETGVVHKDGVSAEHGFVSMLPMSQGRTFVSWLDGRETADPDNPGAMTLRAGIFDVSGLTLNEWELDHRVCDCCQTSSAMTPSGPIVVYRDRSDEEIRDIYLTRHSDGAWSAPQAIHNDNWQIAGCPVNGPSVAAKKNQVAVAWFTAKNDTPKVQLALSNDSGESFSEPVLVASPNTNGRVDTVILDSGRIVVSWMDTTDADAKIMLSIFSAEGRLLDSTEVADSSASRRSGFPIIEGVGESVYVTWTDISSTPQVKLAQVNYDADTVAGNEFATRETNTQQARSIEEIVVTAERTMFRLRVQVEAAENFFYSNYNDLNEINEFDVRCESVAPTGSFITVRECWPTFFKDLVARNSQDALLGIDVQLSLQDLAFVYADVFDDLRANMEKVAHENKSVADSLIELELLSQTLVKRKEECMKKDAVLFLFRKCD